MEIKINCETARPHPFFKTIACSQDGSIYSIKTGQKRKLWKTRLGYLQLSVNRTSYLAHRLIADVFIPNPSKKPYINHKNGNKSDNRIENLEWCTQAENIRHARDVLGVKYGMPGINHPKRKVSEKEVRIIINLWNMGLSEEKISKAMEYALPTIRRHLKNSIKSS